MKSLDFLVAQHRMDSTHQPLFTAISPQGNYMLSIVGINTMTKMASRITQRNGLEYVPSYTGHCFLKSATTNMAEYDVSDQQMKILCRWKSEKIEDTYSRKTERLKGEASKTL